MARRPRRAGLDAAPSAARTARFSAPHPPRPPHAGALARLEAPPLLGLGRSAARCPRPPRPPRLPPGPGSRPPRPPARPPASRFSPAAHFFLHFSHLFCLVPGKVLPSSLESSLFPALSFLLEVFLPPGSVCFPARVPPCCLAAERRGLLSRQELLARCFLRNRNKDDNPGPRSTGGETGVDFLLLGARC